MPKIPIIRPPEYEDRTTVLGEGPDPLAPEQADALKAIEDRTARIDRELAVSQAWRAGVERLSTAEETPGGAPVGFTRGFLGDLDRERQQLVTALPPAGQAPLERDLLDLRADFLDRAAQVEASGMALRRRTALYDALDGYVAGVTRDPGQVDRAVGRMDSLIAGLGLPEDRQGAMRLFVKDVLGNAAVDGLMQDPARAERVLSDGLYDDVLSASSKSLRLKEAQDKVARNAHLDRERTIANLATQAHDGAASDDAILQAQREQRLSAADAAYLIEANARATEAARTRDARIQRVATATERLDPTNPEDRAAGSDYWDSVSEVYASDDPTQQQENELRFVERTGALPRALETRYRAALLSKDPMVVAPGAVAITRLGSLNPALVQEIPPAEMGRANAIAEYAALGVAPDRAVELGDEKVAAERALPTGPTRPGEIQVAANDEPPVMSDGAETGAPADQSASKAPVTPFLPDAGHALGELMRVLGGAARDAAQEVANVLFDLTDPLARFLEKHVPLGSIRISEDGSVDWESGYGEGQLQLPELAKPETVAGAAAKDVVQFLVGFIPALRLAKAAKIASGTAGAARYLGASEKIAQALGSFAESEIAAGVGTVAVFDGTEQRLSNLIQQYPGLANPVSAYLAADPNDSKAEGKLKLALEGLGFSVLMQPFALGLRAIRAARAAKAKSVSEELAGGESALDRSLSGEELPQDVSADRGYESPKENPFPDRILVEDTEHPFTMIRVKRHTTNRKLKRDYERYYGVDWPIDPETGRDMVVHHIIPLLRGGADHVHNIEPKTYRAHIEHHKMNRDFSLAGKRGAKARQEKQRGKDEESG